ncbi:phosphomannomutase/phosphoglucomutase [Candidatus Woesearchaeota archaeon]|nr:phosphomannomutase/phosphoglucomutase [Candidatus Woesearchaeota archaeon]
MEIFRTYDIRGKVPDDLNEKNVYEIARAFVLYAKCKEVRVGQDCRLSSPTLFTAMVKGLTDQGANVIDIGLCSTPMLYHVSKNGPAAMITASHMPKEFNGIKFCRQGAQPVGTATGLLDIKKIVEAGHFPTPISKGTTRKVDILADYVTHCLSFITTPLKPYTVVADAGNGMGGLACTEIFKHIPCTLIPLFFKPDGRFPNHEANPIKPENLKDLQAAVKKHRAHLGAAYDADCDRILFVDENGKIITGDKILGLLALEFLKRQKNATILYDLRSTRTVPETIQKHGGKAMRTPVGHALIKPLMKKHNAIIGGELSGHFFIRDNQYAESADITLLLILSLLSQENKPLSELAKPFAVYAHSGEINFDVEDREKMMKLLKDHYPGARVDTLDGITLDFTDWWFNARPSQNDPVLRLVVEAKTQTMLDEKLAELRRIIAGSQALTQYL